MGAARLLLQMSVFWRGAFIDAMAELICELKKYRQLAGLTQEELAAIVGVRRETIIRLEAGRYNPSLKLAMDLSRAVNTPIEKIFMFVQNDN